MKGVRTRLDKHSHKARQLMVLRFVYDYTQQNNGLSPTLYEIATHIRASESDVRYHVQQLVKLGVLAKGAHAKKNYRAIQVVGAKYENPPFPLWVAEVE